MLVKEKCEYTEEDLIYLERSWGLLPVSRIAKKLGRGEEAIKLKAFRMGLGSQLDNIEFLLQRDIINLLNVDRKTVMRYIKEEGLKLEKCNLIKGRNLKSISYEDFLLWLEEKKEIIDWSKVDKTGILAIGFDSLELDKLIQLSSAKKQRKTLSVADKEKIKKMYQDFWKYEDIASTLNKEYGTIRWFLQSCFENGELEQNTKKGRLVRNIKRDGYGWEKWQDETLIKLFREGKTLREISEIVGKTLGATKSRNQKLSKMIMEGKLVF